MSTKSATGGILLEIKGANNAQLADKLTVTLRSSLKKFQDVRVHQPKQMAEIKDDFPLLTLPCFGLLFLIIFSE